MDFKLSFVCYSVEQVRGSAPEQVLYNFGLTPKQDDPLNAALWPGAANGSISLTATNPQAFKVGKTYIIGFYGG